MTILEHRDYQGEVKFDGDRLLIRILHIDDFITTETDRASEAQAAFVELVDDYIETCEQLGKQPNKPFKGSFNVRMPPKLHKQAAFAAVAASETLNAFVVSAIEERLRSDKVDLISQGVARAMADYAMHSSRREITSQWSSRAHLASDFTAEFVSWIHLEPDMPIKGILGRSVGQGKWSPVR
jgi:predicted HicB family RNase H-like nuclease